MAKIFGFLLLSSCRVDSKVAAGDSSLVSDAGSMANGSVSSSEESISSAGETFLLGVSVRRKSVL